MQRAVQRFHIRIPLGATLQQAEPLRFQVAQLHGKRTNRGAAHEGRIGREVPRGHAPRVCLREQLRDGAFVHLQVRQRLAQFRHGLQLHLADNFGVQHAAALLKIAQG
ncbi:MAG TPA: hypothetical protein VF483_00685 [Gemmatimonadaceae bacterium]